MRYEWVLFDADNTLFDFDQCERQALRLALGNMGVDYVEDHHAIYNRINRECWRAFEEGRISRARLRLRRFELFFAAVGIRDDPEAFAVDYLEELSRASFLIHGAKDLLDELQGRVNMGLVTNGLKEVQRPRLTHAGINAFFGVIVVSDEIGYSKPQAGFFDYTFSQMGYPPRESVLIVGDNLNADIRGGLDYGVDACWYNPNREENPSGISPTFEINRLEELKSRLF